jgi:hypothetical protein
MQSTSDNQEDAENKENNTCDEEDEEDVAGDKENLECRVSTEKVSL